MLAKENKVVALGFARIKSKKTGKVFATEFAYVFHLQDGKVIKYQAAVTLQQAINDLLNSNAATRQNGYSNSL